jgi:hypothetical protein
MAELKGSHQAKKIKSLIRLGTMSAIQVKGDLQDYCARKLKEGKPPMLVINVANNKLIHRVYAVVRQRGNMTKFIRPRSINPRNQPG